MTDKHAHEPAAVLGRTPKTLQVSKDARGLAFGLDPAPTAGKDALELMRRGGVTGASFHATWRVEETEIPLAK